MQRARGSTLNQVAWVLLTLLLRSLGVAAFLFSPRIASLDVTVEAPAAILINAETGAVLFERNAEAPHYPASITKIATALYLLERKGNNLDELATASSEAVAAISPEAKRRQAFRCPSHWLEFGGTHMGLKKGEQMSLRALLNGLMLESANDAANVLAEHVAGNVPNFVAELNEWLIGLGCRQTHFTNPHGLHHPEHVTTARDMALITRHALSHPVFQEVVKSVRATRPKTNLQEPSTLSQHNRLLKPGKYFYPKAIGVKTGYHSDAKSTLVSAAREKDRTLIAVVLSSKGGQTFQDSINLFEAAFAEAKVSRRIVSAGPQDHAMHLRGARNKLTTCLADDIILSFYPSEAPNIRAVLIWNKDLAPPIRTQEVVGRIEIRDDRGILLAESPLLAARDVKLSIRYALQAVWRESAHFRKGAQIAVLISVALGLVIVLHRRRRLAH